MIENPKIGQEVWFLVRYGQSLHRAKIINICEVEVSAKKYPYADIELEDGCRIIGESLKTLYASKEEFQKELEKKQKGNNNND